MLRQAWTGGRHVSSICTDRTDFEMLFGGRNVLLLFEKKSQSNIQPIGYRLTLVDGVY